MSSMIRKRFSSVAQTISDAVAATTVSDHDDDLDDLRFTQGITAPSLIKAAPQHQGPVLKLNVSIFYTILPGILQVVVQKIAWLTRLLAPQWKQRHLILLGSYLYKFADNVHPTKGPKGAPIRLPTMAMDIVSLPALQKVIGSCALPPGYTTVLCISTLRKRQYYAVASRETATEWIHALQVARQEAITRSMGHAPSDSFPKSWAYYDTLGASLANKKERIRNRLETHSLQDMKMSSFNDVGPMPSGYFS